MIAKDIFGQLRIQVMAFYCAGTVIDALISTWCAFILSLGFYYRGPFLAGHIVPVNSFQMLDGASIEFRVDAMNRVTETRRKKQSESSLFSFFYNRSFKQKSALSKHEQSCPHSLNIRDSC